MPNQENHLISERVAQAGGNVSASKVAGEGAGLSRRVILDATTGALRRYGYEGTTIRKIAAELGCAVGSIYRYFEDKHELLSAVAEELLEPVAVAVENNVPVEVTIGAYHRQTIAGREMYQMMFWLASIGQGTHLPGVVERIILGWAKQMDSRLLAQRCWSILHGGICQGLDAGACMDQITTMLKHDGLARQVVGTRTTSGGKATALMEEEEREQELTGEEDAAESAGARLHAISPMQVKAAAGRSLVIEASDATTVSADLLTLNQLLNS